MPIIKDKYWLSSGFYSMLHRAAELGLSFGIFFILVRILSKDEFGVWSLFLVVTSIIEMARTAFVANSMIQFAVSNPSENFRKILTASFTLNILVTVVSIVLLISFSGLLSSLWSAPELKQLFYIYCLSSFVFLFYSQGYVILMSKLDFKGGFWVQFVRLSMNFTFVLVLLILKYTITLEIIIWSQFVILILSTIFTYFLTKDFFKIDLKPNKEWFSKLFQYSKYVFGTNVVSVSFKNIDKMVMGAILDTAKVGSYNAATRISSLIDAPLTAISATVFPKTAERIKTDGEKAVKYLYERSVGLMLALIIPIIILGFIFADYIMLFIAGREYLDVVPVFRVTIFLSILKPFDRQSGVFLDAIGKPNINFITVAIGLVISMILTFVGIKMFGIIGAAYAALISLFISVFYTHIILAKLLKINPFNGFIYAGQFYTQGFEFAVNFLKKKKK